LFVSSGSGQKLIFNTHCGGVRPIGGRRQFPKEAVFQQLFHAAMSSLLPAYLTVLPEMNTSVVIDGGKVLGELDFYINENLQWALELVRRR
jgi:hypothetical protein